MIGTSSATGIAGLSTHSSKRLVEVPQSQVRRSFGPTQPDDKTLFNPSIQITPANSVKRLGTGWRRWFTESIHSPSGNKVEFRFQGPMHLLVVYSEGARRKGETTIEGLTPSTARSFVNKLTFVPAGLAYREWHETSVSTRVSFLYLDPDKLLLPYDASIEYRPRLHFDDPIVCETAVKLKSVIESGEPKSAPYLEALSSVLAHELSRPDRDLSRISSVSRGGLAGWQKRAVTEHIEANLSKQICLNTLAVLVRLSEHHFCRSFKRSFGVPPHQYHVQRRMEKAKALLMDPSLSITEIGLMLGYSQTSSFSVAFRKTLGWTPSKYRREFR